MASIPEEFKRRAFERKLNNQLTVPTADLTEELREVRDKLRIAYATTNEVKEVKEQLINHLANHQANQLSMSQSLNRLQESVSRLEESINSSSQEKQHNQHAITQLSTKPIIQSIAKQDVEVAEDKSVEEKNQVKPSKENVSNVSLYMPEMPERLQRLVDILKMQKEWISYEQLGKLCTPALTKNAVRGYVSELIANFGVVAEKKKVGRQTFVRLIING